MAKTLITCDCLGTQSVDAEGLAKTTGLTVAPPCSELCTRQIDQAAAALAGGDVVFACGQERAIFDALADELGLPPAPTLLSNTCYSYTAPDEAVSISGVYANHGGTLTSVAGAGGTSPIGGSASDRESEARQAEAWFRTVTGDAFG